MEGVVKQVLASVQADLYDNLPLDVDFINRLHNEHLINDNAAKKLRPLARNGDQSCIQELIDYMRTFFDEATLNKFCTFLDKYGQDGRPVMVKLAAKISMELKGKANELKDPGSKRSQTPSVDHQPPPKKSHSAQEALGSPPSQATLPSQLAPPTQPTLPSLYQHREVRDERDFGGEVNEPGPSGSKRSQLHSDDQYSQPKRPYSTTKAPRAGMDDKIGSCIDILGVSAYRKGLINNMAILGLVLGIEEETQAILNRNGPIDAHLLEILRRYINETSPTWRDFCTALEKNTLFKDVREKIEADHNSKPGGPGVSAGDEQAVRFAIIATTKTEWESAKFFMGLHMSKCDIKLKLKMHLIEKKLDDFKELYGREADDMSDGITRNIVGDHGTYTYIEVCGVRGVLTKCSKKGSHGLGAAGLTVADLLKISQDNKWDLEAVFIVGCCACASSAEKKVDLGAVLIANPIRQYSMKVTVENTALLLNKDDYFRIDPASKWLQLLEVPNDMPAVIEELKVRTLFSATFLSGDVMMNAGETFRENLNLPRLGFEMEGTGAHTAKQYYEIFSDKRQTPPAILVVKGVSDLADPDKNKSADTLFFKEKVNDFDEDSRQQMCTMMSLMIVFRAIKAKWPRGEKKKNPEAPS